jgi:hypothetical protein
MVAVGRHHLRPGKDGLGLLHIAVERRQGGAVNGRSISRGRTRRRARAAASLTACLLVSLALAESAAATRAPALRLHGYKLRIFNGPAGSRSILNKISEDGTAVGQRLLADGTSHSLVFGRVRSPRGSLGGRQSALVATDVNDDKVGSLFGPNGMTRPLFLGAGGQAKTLPVVGSANAVAPGPLVAITVAGTDGQQHVQVWNPATGAVVDRGPGVATGIGFDGTVLGRTVAGQAAYWTPAGARQDLGFPGVLIHINLFGQVVGFTKQSGAPTPITLNLRSPAVVTPLALPRGWRYGTATDISDSGLVVGTAFKKPTGGLPGEGIAWTGPKRPVVLNSLLPGRARRGVQITDAAGVDDNGLIVGSATRSAARKASASAARPVTEYAIVLEPNVAAITTKVNNMADVFLSWDGYYVDPRDYGVYAEMFGAPSGSPPLYRFLADGRLVVDCGALKKQRSRFEALDFSKLKNTFKNDAAGFDFMKEALLRDLEELKRETNCP